MSDDGDDDDVGYGKPPKSGQFQPGHSGNPGGRPPKKKPEPSSDYGGGLTPFDRDFLKEGKRPVRGREGDRVIELPQDRAAMRGLYAKAIRGSPMANRILIEESRRIQANVMRMRQEFRDSCRTYVANWPAAAARAKAAGLPAPLPHPDDIEFADDLRVNFLGPMNAEELERSQKCVDFRDLFLAMHVHGCADRRPADGNEDEVNLFCWLQSWDFDRNLPPSLRIGTNELNARANRLVMLRYLDLEKHIRALCERVGWPLWVAIYLSRTTPRMTLETLGFKRVYGTLIRERRWSAAKQKRHYWANASVDHLTTEKLEFLIAWGFAGPPSWIARARASIAARERVGFVDQ